MNQLGKYVLLDRIKVGGMAEIWRGYSSGPGGFLKKAAIKVVLPCYSEDAEFIQMFMDEAVIASRLTHANIAQIYDFDVADGTPYLAMEYVEGKDLHSILEQASERGEPLPWPLACAIAMEVAKGLYYVHTRRDASRPLAIIHRDISPRNIMISNAGEVKIVDFGIARSAGRSTITQAGEVKGKCAYMSPEQALGRMVDPRTDIFSLGVVLFEMLTGKRLFGGGTQAETLTRLLKAQIPPLEELNPKIPEAISQVVLKTLQREPSNRFPTMLAFYDILSQELFAASEYPGSPQLAWYIRELFPDDLEEVALSQEDLDEMDMEKEQIEITVSETGEWERSAEFLSPTTKKYQPPKDLKDDFQTTKVEPKASNSSFRRWDRKELKYQAQQNKSPGPSSKRGLLYIVLGILLGLTAVAAWDMLLNLKPVVQAQNPAISNGSQSLSDVTSLLEPDLRNQSEIGQIEGSIDVINAVLLSDTVSSASREIEPEVIKANTPLMFLVDAHPDQLANPEDVRDSAREVNNNVDTSSTQEAKHDAPSVKKTGRITPEKSRKSRKSRKPISRKDKTRTRDRTIPSKKEAALVQEDGVIRATAKPWAEVWINGSSRGDTPVSLKIKPGSYEVILKNVGRVHTCSVRLDPGERATCHKDFTTPEKEAFLDENP
jgi:serine/threonine protein kinase